MFSRTISKAHGKQYEGMMIISNVGIASPNPNYTMHVLNNSM